MVRSIIDWRISLKNVTVIKDQLLNGCKLNEDLKCESNENKNENDLSFKLTSTCTYITINFFLLSFLVNFFNTNNRLNGLLFLFASILILTYLTFYSPSELKRTAEVHAKALKWIHAIFSMGLILYLVHSYPQSISAFILTISIGLKIFRDIPFNFPRIFSYNELIILSTLMSSGLLSFISHFLLTTKPDRVEITIIEHAIVWLILMLILVKRFEYARYSILGFSLACLFPLAFYFLPICYIITSQNPFIWLYEYLFHTSFKRLFLFFYWLILFNFMGLVILIQKYLLNREEVEFNKEKINKPKSKESDSEIDQSGNHSKCKSSERAIFTDNFYKHKRKIITSMRKLFHILICLVYMMGLIYDRQLLHLCSFGMLILLIILETIRLNNIGKVSEIIQDMTKLFADEKDDCSSLVLSHIYLLVGLSFPLWISDIEEFHVSQLSGLLTVGVGDTFASLVGSFIGKHKYPNSNKSIEGSLALIISQFSIYLLLNHYNVINLFNAANLAYTFINILLSAYVEAFTWDNDNLILPIVVYPFLFLMN